MELNEIITALGGSAGVVAIVKAFLTSREAKAITDDRKVSKESYDSRFAKLETRVDALEKRMDEGLERFQQLDSRLDEISGTLRELKGMFALYLKMREKDVA